MHWLLIDTWNCLHAECLCFWDHLQGFVKPAVATVPLAASSMQHLDGGTAAVRFIRQSGHPSIKAHGEYAPLDG